MCLDEPTIVSSLIDLLQDRGGGAREYDDDDVDVDVDVSSDSYRDDPEPAEQLQNNTKTKTLSILPDHHICGCSDDDAARGRTKRVWKKVTLNSCTGHGAMVALAIPPGHILQSIAIHKCRHLAGATSTC